MADEQGHYTKDIPIPIPDKRHIAPLQFGIVCTCWNQELLQPLIARTKAALEKLGVEARQIQNPIVVPGSFELPFAAQALAQSGEVDAVLCFGLLIKGETAHFEYISNAASQGITPTNSYLSNYLLTSSLRLNASPTRLQYPHHLWCVELFNYGASCREMWRE